MVTFEIQTDELPEGQLVDNLIELIEQKLQKVTIEKDGSLILVSGDEGALTKRKLRFLTRKFLYSEGFRNSTKVVAAGGPAYRILYRPVEHEEEHEPEELEELESFDDDDDIVEIEELDPIDDDDDIELIEED